MKVIDKLKSIIKYGAYIIAIINIVEYAIKELENVDVNKQPEQNG